MKSFYIFGRKDNKNGLSILSKLSVSILSATCAGSSCALRGQQPFQAPMQGQPVPPQGNTAGNGIIWVQGEEGAKGYLDCTRRKPFAVDSENSTFYIKSTDASGMPLPLRVILLYRTYGAKKASQSVQESSVQFATKEELAALAARLDALTAQKQPAKEQGAKEDESNA